MLRFNYCLILLIFATNICGQSFWFGPKLGPTLASQRWNDFDPNLTLTYNADIFIESYSEENKSSLYASLGYRIRGASIRTFNLSGVSFGSQGFKFRNAVLELGAKSLFNVKWGDFIPYYMIGARLEYNLSTNLKDYERFGTLFYPSDPFVCKWTAGGVVGGGFEWNNFGEFIKPFFEMTLNPDFVNQYYQPPIDNVLNQFGQAVTTRERAIRNFTIEFKLGFKFLRKVEYY